MATCECPYEYLVSQYGAHHFRPFVEKLRPSLSVEDPAKFELVLDIMDAVHFCAILVDDIADRSPLRKNKAAAHLLFGATETSNKAYLILTRIINRTMRERPGLVPELLKALEEIHQGQDESLAWRRHGLDYFPREDADRLQAYKTMARRKTGSCLHSWAGFWMRVVPTWKICWHGSGRFHRSSLLTPEATVQLSASPAAGTRSFRMTARTYILQNMRRNKGSVAEDLLNSDFSYPIVVALNHDGAEGAVAKALQSRSNDDIEAALLVLESAAVRNACLEALQEASHGVEDLVAAWGRQESMARELACRV